ncbi:uncharacterized protein ACNS7B_017002 isoform 2-T2 [Menidia menidia]
MAFPFKIPKKKNSGGSDSAHEHLQSPLSRLQSHAPQLKGYGNPPNRGGASRMHAGSSWNSLRPPFRQAVQSLLGLSGPEPAANQGAAGGGSGQSQPGPRGPKRAAHRLLPPEPPQKKSSAAPPPGGLSVAAGDALSALRAQVHAGSPPAQVHAGKPPAQVHAGRPPSEPPQKKKQAPLELKRDGWRRFQEGRNQNPRPWRAPRAPAEPRGSPRNPAEPRGSPRNPGEPIVLSSEEEAEDGEQKGGGATDGEQKGGGATDGEQKGGGATDGEQKGGGATDGEQKGGGATDGEQKRGGATDGEQKGGGATDGEQPDARGAPGLQASFLQLDFVSLHAGLLSAPARGPITVTASGITIPVKG